MRRRVDQVQRQVEVLVEDGADLGLVVRKDERAARGARGGGRVQLGREADRAVLEVRPVDGLAVRDVELEACCGVYGSTAASPSVPLMARESVSSSDGRLVMKPNEAFSSCAAEW